MLKNESSGYAVKTEEETVYGVNFYFEEELCKIG